MIYRSPYAGIADLSPPSRRQAERHFVAHFKMAVETLNPAEERWAHGRMRELHAQAAELDTSAPSFFDTLRWACAQPDSGELPW